MYCLDDKLYHKVDIEIDENNRYKIVFCVLNNLL